MRIYLVEDNPFILKWLGQALEQLMNSKIIGSTASAFEACSWLAAHQAYWEVAVVDLWLAQGNGLQVIKSIAKTPYQKVVVLTNYATEQMRQLCLSAGADAFFDKSMELDEFANYVIDETTHH
ncbi:MAG: hypothetical protein JWR60_3868 [Polaromonas sp.]|nr:hypothetical protein [Polaromonas sp.]